MQNKCTNSEFPSWTKTSRSQAGVLTVGREARRREINMEHIVTHFTILHGTQVGNTIATDFCLANILLMSPLNLVPGGGGRHVTHTAAVPVITGPSPEMLHATASLPTACSITPGALPLRRVPSILRACSRTSAAVFPFFNSTHKQYHVFLSPSG